MNQHKLEGDKCLLCGQQGLELEDECPVDVGALIRPHKTPVSAATQKKLDRIKVIKASDLPPATAKTPKLAASAPDDPRLEEVARKGLAKIGQGTKLRRSWNESQNALYLDSAASVIATRFDRQRNESKGKFIFSGEELKRLLASCNLEARHTDQWEAIDNPP